ncbi:MAG: hypothetical protein QXF83_06935, partial [Candidatus Bathyarchaeia archaeon]
MKNFNKNRRDYIKLITTLTAAGFSLAQINEILKPTEALEINKDYIDFKQLASNPSIAKGRLAFVGSNLIFSPNGSAFKNVYPADWADLLNKPSSFPPSAHASSHAPGGSDSLSSYYLVGLKKYAEVSVSSDTTVLDVTGLNINSHKFYWVICKFKNPLTSSVTYYMFIEGDTNQANYQHRYLYGDGSTVYTGQNNSATL